MNEPEFKTWFGYHRTHFLALDSWLGSLPTVAPESDPDAPTQGRVLRNWLGVLSKVSLQDAKAASDAMYREEIEHPKDWAKVPMVIRRYCERLAARRRQANQYSSGEQTFGCPQCLDSGSVSIWHRQAIKRALEGMPLTSVATKLLESVGCGCDATPQWQASRFNPEIMLPVEPLDFIADDRSKFTEFLERLRARRHAQQGQFAY